MKNKHGTNGRRGPSGGSRRGGSRGGFARGSGGSKGSGKPAWKPTPGGRADWKPAPQKSGWKPDARAADSTPASHEARSSPDTQSSDQGKSQQPGWDHIADWYDKLVGDAGSDYHQNVIIPAALRLLEPHHGERLFDLCCGQGVFVRKLLEAGAGFAMGVDASPRLIAAARERTPVGPRVRFRVGDATQGGDWVDASYDGATCIMSAQDVADLEGLAIALAGVLRVGGRAVMVIMHPCFRIPRQSNWGWDYEKKSQYRRIDRYASAMEIPIATRPGASPGTTNLFHHRPLADYVNTLAAAGLMIDRCEEPLSHRRADSGGRGRGENRAAEEIPVFLALRAIKPEPRRIRPTLPTIPTPT